MEAGRGPRILLVEDDPDVRFVLATALGRELSGAAVVAVPDAYQALAMLREEPFDAAVIDLVMPGASGLELLSRMATLPTPVPAIVVTAVTAGAMVDEAERSGARAVLTKPVDPRRLADEVARVAGHTSATPTTT
jgi:CheY-like chemotaxis protein